MNQRKIFVVAGMPRVGTTFLYHYLQEHPEIALPPTKELNFFSLHYDMGLGYYDRLLPTAPTSHWVGDISPIYFMDQQAPERIRASLPSAKIILGVREPTDWVISFHNQLMTHSRHPPEIDEMCTGFDWEIEDRTIPVAITPGFVPGQIDRFARTFGSDLLLYSFTLLRADPLSLLNRVEDALGISRHFTEANFENRYINASARKNIKWATYALRQPLAAKLLRGLLPAAAIQRIRHRLETATAPRSLEERNDDSEARLRLKPKLAADDAFIESRFSGRHFMTGDEWLALADSPISRE